MIYNIYRLVIACRTDLGYTVIVKDSGEIRLFDNMQGYSVEEIKKKINNLYTEEKIASKNSAKSKLYAKITNNYDDSKLLSYSFVEYYDKIEDKIYELSLFDIEDENGYKSGMQYEEEL